MVPRDCGAVVQVGSALAYRGIPLQSAYCGAKHAIKGFTESICCELRHAGSKTRVVMVELPGLNTPQFDHCRTRLPRHPKPVPPIYQPEVAAEAVHWAAHHDRRELYVGAPTVKTIVGNKVAPGLVERYLARMAVDAQQDDRPVPDGRPDNLFAPVGGDPGAHGDFDSESRSRSIEAWLSRNRGALAAAAAGTVALALATRGSLNGSKRRHLH
jgi:hypothetical protein